MTDRTTDYARKVTKGKIVAGPHVRDACKRHLDDLKRKDIHFDKEKAQNAIDYYEQVLCLNGGEFEGVPFKLLPWQCFVVGSIFGWMGEDGLRRFRIAYIETGKGSGKSPLVAGMGLIGLTSDNEPRAEIYAAAVKKDQARVLFRDAVAMVEMSPELSQRLSLSGGADPTNIAYMSKGSFFRPISSEERGRGQSGPRPHMGILDEIHEHPSNTMVEMLRAGTKQRRQALIVMITNSGSDRRTPCWNYHEYGAKVSEGTLDDDGFFAYVCAMDDKDDPFESEDCWEKANPSLDVTPGRKYLREQVREAKGMPSKEALVRRLNFCEWVEGVNPLFSKDVWLSTLHPLELRDYEGRTCIGALDLSSKRDLTALALIFEDEHGLDVLLKYWTPKDTLAERARSDMAPYEEWERQGFLIAIEGKAVDYDVIAKFFIELQEDYNITVDSLAYDRWKIDHLMKAFDDFGVEHHNPKEEKYGYGIKMVNFGQGYKDMAPAIDSLEGRVLNKTIRIEANPVTTMCAANAAIAKDPAENRKFEKSKSTGRIDGMVALTMGVQAFETDNEEEGDPQILVI
jgi:phage terminase large subunit-like protein